MTRVAVSPLIQELRAALGAAQVLSAPADLVAYECDGFTIEKNPPDAVVFPAFDRRGRRGRPDLQPARRAGRAARGGHEPGRRLPAARRRRRGHAHADEADRRDQPPRSLRRGRGRRAERRSWAGPWPAPATTSPPIRRARGPARSAATWPPTPAARTRSSTASPSTTCSASRPCWATARSLRVGPVDNPAGLGPDRRAGRQRRHAGHRHQGLGPPDAQSGRLSHDAGDLRDGRRRHQRDQRHHRRRASSRPRWS